MLLLFVVWAYQFLITINCFLNKLMFIMLFGSINVYSDNTGYDDDIDDADKKE